MTLSRVTLAASIVAASVTTCLAVAHATTTSISTPWKRGEPVTITGDNLDGDAPEYKKLCIAPEGAKDTKQCYYDFELNLLKWNNSTISFYPPDNLPTRGVVILQLQEATAKCFGSAGCVDTTEDVESEIGSFTVTPYISNVIEGNILSGKNATAIEAGKSYQITGTYFGDEKGTIYIRQSRGSRKLPDDKITSWTNKSILFVAPSDIETGNGVSVNNFGSAQWYDFPTTSATSSSTTNGPTDSAKSVEEIDQEIDDLNQDFAKRWGGEHNGETYVGTENQAFAKTMLKILQDSQATIDKYGSKVKQVGSACMSLNDKENTHECQSVCANKTEEIVHNACENIGSTDIKACMETGKQYVSVQDGEKECVTSCLKLCVAGTECVCQEGRVNKDAYRDLDMAKRNLVSAYKTLNEETASDKYLVEALKQELEKTGLVLTKNGEAVTLVKSQTGQSATVGVTFSDVSKVHPYASAIDWAKQSGILQGYPDGTFKPDNVVNRAEFLKIVLAARGIDVSTTAGSSGFKDVDENAWYAPYVRYAKAQGIIQGYPDGTFKPNQAVNFAEALKMAYNALGITTSDIGGSWYDRYLQHAKANNVLYANDVQIDGGMSRKDVVWITWKLMTHVGDWQQPSKITTTPPPTTNTSTVQFKDGNFVVGKDIQPGTYRTRKASSGCYYSRLSGFSGELDDIINNELTNAPTIVTIDVSDMGFKSSNCGTWTQDLSAITTSRTSFADGMFIVGTDIDAGTYKSSGGESCYYSRLSGFGGGIDSIISNELTSESAIVTISAGDKGFKSAGCGTWTKM